ncbi:uncharacterized protein [Pagrus major]|uniref:uncharacterized protein n=1 Tax=Pagrus major TaxID=143350 RepID=UPI003CC83D75
MSSAAASDSLTFTFLGNVISANVSWSADTSAVIRKAQQRLHFLRVLRRRNVCEKLLVTFYRSTIECILTCCISVWFSHCTRQTGRVQRGQDSTEDHRLPPPPLKDIYSSRCLRRAELRQRHPAHHLLHLLPSGRRYRSIRTRTTRLRNSFFPQAITSVELQDFGLRMWQQTESFCLILSAIITGSLSDSWDMKVSPGVTVSRGEDAVLSCSFTHPRQQLYSGPITVKWLARETDAYPFFKCSVRNDSMEDLKDCSGSGLKHSLKGDPRQGDLSLLMRKVHVTDTGKYFCRVELDGWTQYYEKETHLLVTVKPQILSLSVAEPSHSSGSAPRRLQCEVEGHPLPNITWLSASRGLLTEHVYTSRVSQDRLLSSVPYVEGEVFTCRVESVLGGAERSFPTRNSLVVTLTVCGLLVLLLLCAGVICCRRRRVENHRLQSFNSPSGGDGELQLVYTAGSLNTQHESLRSSDSPHLEEAGVVYSLVNIQ